VQGVGYPNPDRSHFESMDIWQSADPKRAIKSGWLGRAGADLMGKGGDVPLVHIGPTRLPLALQGTAGGVVSVNNKHPYHLELGGGIAAQHKVRRQLLQDLAKPSGGDDDLLAFVQKRQMQTLTSIERLQEVLTRQALPQRFDNSGLGQRLQLIAQLIAAGFGTRVFYTALDGFDTHAAQSQTHAQLMADLGNGVSQFFNTLKGLGHDKRVALMTFSEFGRRVQENGSKGTDHGAGSCLFVAGPNAKGVVGKHPSLSDLDSGDLRHHTDFRRVYATLLDDWLKCDSRAVLGDKWEHVDGLKVKA
jgi:uncharacterized protein (DUF1501 family)